MYEEDRQYNFSEDDYEFANSHGFFRVEGAAS